MALWIEALEPGKPLTFLDSHIRCGDSLIGVFDISVLHGGIQDDAFKPLSGDEKAAASYYRTKNKREIDEREKVETGLGLTAGQNELSKAFATLQAQMSGPRMSNVWLVRSTRRMQLRRPYANCLPNLNRKEIGSEHFGTSKLECSAG